jgi:hypothetical protein
MSEQTHKHNPVDSLGLAGAVGWVENFIPELHHCNLIYLSPSIGNSEFCTIDEIVDYIDRHYQEHTTNHIVFNSESEGFFRLLVDRVNELLKILLTKYKLDPRDISYLSGALPTEANTNLFYELVDEPINLYYVSAWPSAAVTNNHEAEQWAEHIDNSIEKTKLLLCYNNAPKLHRLATVAELFHRGIAHSCYMSACFAQDELELPGIKQAFPTLGSSIKEVLLDNQGQFPLELTISKNEFLERTADHFGIGLLDYLHHRNSYFSVITETQFFNKENNQKFHESEPSYSCDFATEKTFRTMIAKHPFIMISTPYFLQALRAQGYKTFHPYINESYDEIYDDETRLVCALNEVSRLAAFSREQWLQWLSDIEPIVEHNFQHLKNNHQYAIRA